MTEIAGRQQELRLLNELYQSKDPEFLAVYGRRRVGKTFIIREFFQNKGLYFELTGLKDGNLKDQLENFSDSFAKTFHPGLDLKAPETWREAFRKLNQELLKTSNSKKIILFLDELPWLSTKRSKFMQTLDYFWNSEWSKRKNIILIVCGSAASWMIEKLINAKGGLHNRLTKTLLLKPYTLEQTKEFLESRNIKLNNKQILDIYMAIGGIPYYLKAVKKGYSATQNINNLCFQENGLLFNEFQKLFASLFENAELNAQIIRTIADTRHGLDIQTLSEKINKKTGGTLTKRLNELEAAGFIQKFLPYGKTKREQYFRVIDEYSYFYLKWIEPFKEQSALDNKTEYWQLASQTPSWKSWSGYAFESTCYKHVFKIRSTLGLDKIHCSIGNWRSQKNKSQAGAQIDLIIDRQDGFINLCEIKYNEKKLTIDKDMALNLLNKIDAYKKQFPTEKHISLTMITASGIKENSWSNDLVEKNICLDNLF